MTQLKPYQQEQEEAVRLIRRFWQCHNGTEPAPEEARQDLVRWTGRGHRLYFILEDGRRVGFLHLAARGNEIDWLEDIFVLPEYQNRGIGTSAIRLAEELVRQYSPALYLEAAARNERAIRLYRRLGYDCLNTVTLRKDFRPDAYECVEKAELYDCRFDIRRRR